MAGQHKRLSPLDMLLLCVTVSCLLFGSSAGLIFNERCYGASMDLPFSYTPPVFRGKMYFRPRSGGSRKLIMDNGEAKDPRLDLSYGSAKLRDLTERDDGTFSTTILGSRASDVIRLKILDCSEKITRYYGSVYSRDVPRDTEFLEFTRLHSEDHLAIIWNRTNTQINKGGRVQVTRNGRSFTINELTQADNGHYNFRGKDNTLLKRIKLEIKEHFAHYAPKVNEWLSIEKLFGGPLWTVSFKRIDDEEDFSVPVVERGELVRHIYTFARRLWLDDGNIQIDGVESRDSGTFEFRDQQGNLAQIVELDVIEEEVPTGVIVGIFAGIFVAVIICCCCVRKCCCKKSSSKREESSLPVFHHDSTQPAAPSSSAAPAPRHSYQPVNSHVPKEPAASSFKPSVNTPVNIHVNPLQPEVAPPREERTDPAPSLGSDCLSSDPGPQFEIKGLPYLTALPLSSESTFTDVYTSDKLNNL